MMTRGVKVRLVTFVVLAAVGIVYVAAAYLGLVDRILGRGFQVTASLPGSGGLYIGSEVDYRGVAVGKVSKMTLTRRGVDVTLSMKQGTKLPRNAAMHVGDLSAVGEQYLDFEPSSAGGPYLAAGDRISAGSEALPIPTDTLLKTISDFTDSVDKPALQTVVGELGTTFAGNATNLRSLLDSGSDFVRQASAHQQATIDLLEQGKQALATQQAHSGDILTFAHGLDQLTGALKAADPDLRTILQGGPTTLQAVQSLVDGLQPVLPQFLVNLATVNQVLTVHLPALEETLVALPIVAVNGFIGTPGDGYGHLNMQLTYTTPACTQGYEPVKDWLPPTDLTPPDTPAYPAVCTDPRAQPGYSGADGITQRGVNMAPAVPKGGPANLTITSYDPSTGQAQLSKGRTVTVKPQTAGQGPLSVLSGGWESMLLGTAR